VYLPNQFWKHKNHGVAFEAIKIARDRGVRINLACTGYPADYRHAQYFAELWAKASQWNVRDQIFYLGVLPREHVLLLMRQSICVLNPSLFEGWGMSVDEARSLGKQALISDIPAHREQNPPGAVFFDPRNAHDLADKLQAVWLDTPPGPDHQREKAARQEQPKRVRSFAEKFVELCEETCREVNR
jgi:glycosyltransferase involved in cell wall biosynthesis